MEYLDKVLFYQCHFGKFVSERFQEKWSGIVGLYVLVAKIYEYLTVGFWRVQIVASLSDIGSVLIAPWLLSAAIVRDEDFAAWFEPILRKRWFVKRRESLLKNEMFQEFRLNKRGDIGYLEFGKELWLLVDVEKSITTVDQVECVIRKALF